MSDILQLLRNALIALGVLVLAILLIFMAIAPPRMVVMTVTDAYDEGIPGAAVRGVKAIAAGNTFLFFVFGEDDFYLSIAGYETTEIEIGDTVEVFRGDVEFSSWTGHLHRLQVKMQVADSNLLMERYEGVVTTGEDPQVLAIHSKYQGGRSLTRLRRQYTNDGKNFDALPYVALVTEDNQDGSVENVFLDFSHADGGALEYVPPQGWPAGNRMRRIEYSMTNAPAVNYQARFAIHQRQSSTPYEIGSTFFYCKIKGRYCAGQVTTFYDRGKNRQHAHVKLEINRRAGDRRTRMGY